MPADLHIHTTASDGKWEPNQLGSEACKRGLNIIAVTDHDSTNGVVEVMENSPKELTVIPGVDLSTDYLGAEVHILGYNLNYQDVEFQTTMEKLRQNRIGRAKL